MQGNSRHTRRENWKAWNRNSILKVGSEQIQKIYKNKLKYTWNIRKTLELEAVFVYSRFIVY